MAAVRTWQRGGDPVLKVKESLFNPADPLKFLPHRSLFPRSSEYSESLNCVEENALILSVVKGQNCQIGWRLQKGSRNSNVHTQNNTYKHTQPSYRYITGHLFGFGEQNEMTGEFVLKCL